MLEHKSRLYWKKSSFSKPESWNSLFLCLPEQCVINAHEVYHSDITPTPNQRPTSKSVKGTEWNTSLTVEYMT